MKRGIRYILRAAPVPWRSLKKYHEDTQNNLIEALPEWKSNLILHTLVAVGPLNLSKVDIE